ncbi:restriction endonuclease subunit S [Candidatus Peregrinibacteria bacterium]|nr:MAG: restriction endonuclease subunit S [Candidatus Peregrinibacteria bacterium]
MKSNYKKIGDYIQIVNERNTDLTVSTLLGVNMTKNFMPTVANMTSLDLSKYKIVRKGRFACNIMHVGRDERLPISLFEKNEPALVSPAYITFEVKDSKKLLPEFLMTIFQKPEFDRLTWYVSDSSVRGGLEWERFCEIEIPIPDDIEVQKSVIAAYKGLLKNQSGFEKSLSDLQFICDTYIENLIKTEKPKVLGEYIEKIIQKNSDDSINEVVGVSERKEFRLPSGKVNKENLSNHLIVKKNEFAYIPRMNPFKPLAVALSNFNYPVVVSASYVAFKVIDAKIILPEFLLLFLKRAEFDRYAAFNAWSSTRDTFDWTDMCSVKLPIPDIEVQKSIVAIHHALESRKRINEDLKKMITPLCPILIKGVTDNLSKI